MGVKKTSRVLSRCEVVADRPKVVDAFSEGFRFFCTGLAFRLHRPEREGSKRDELVEAIGPAVWTADEYRDLYES